MQATKAADLAELDEAGVTPFHLKVLLVSGMGFFTDAYDLFIISVVIKILKDQWSLSATDTAVVDSVATLASAIGAIVFGRVADMLGRRRIYGLEVLVLAAGAIACALAPSLWWLVAFRFLLGIGIGGDYPVSATIMSEYSGKRNRGLLVSLVFAMQAAGLIVGPLLAVAFLSTNVPHEIVWRTLLGLGAVPALAVFYFRRQIDETPRYKLANNNHNTASGPPAIQPQTALDGFVVLLRNRRLLTWLVGAAGTWLLLDYAYYGNTVSSQLLLGTIDPQKDVRVDTLIQLGIFVVAAAPGYVLAAWLLDRLGRRNIQIAGFIGMSVCYAAIALVPGVATAIVPFVVLFGSSYFFTEFGPNTTTFVYPSEIFPVRVRTTAHGIAASSGKIGAFIGTFALPIVLDRAGVALAELSVAVVCVAGALLTLVLPEPKGQTLEDMTRLSGEADEFASKPRAQTAA
ncbi:MAG: MFS transporter [Chloroflexi bacterium]|nr:MFS transporter [Chloroflexota bacterium]